MPKSKASLPQLLSSATDDSPSLMDDSESSVSVVDLEDDMAANETDSSECENHENDEILSLLEILCM